MQNRNFCTHKFLLIGFHLQKSQKFVSQKNFPLHSIEPAQNVSWDQSQESVKENPYKLASSVHTISVAFLCYIVYSKIFQYIILNKGLS